MTMRNGDWMETYTGAQYYPADPRVEDVRLLDIAHHLSMECRFCGACHRFYSVAEHCVHVSRVVPKDYALVGLLHDAPEAYIKDIHRPLKVSLGNYKDLERLNWAVIAERFRLPAKIPAEVHYADNAVLMAERAQLMAPTGRAWNIPVTPADITVQAWSPELAKREFLWRYVELTGEAW